MKSPRLAFGLLFVIAACAVESRVDGPTVTVERLDPAANCFARCDVTPASTSVLLDHRCPEPPVTCGFDGGTDRVRVLADYGNLEFLDPSKVPAAVVHLFFDEQEVGSGFPLQLRVDGGVSSVGEFTMPARNATSLRMTVRAADNFSTDVNGLTVNAIQPSMTVAGCVPLASCQRAANVGVLPVTLLTASNAPSVSASVTSWLNDVPQGPAQTFDLPLSATGLRQATLSLDVPDAPGATWTITAVVGGTALPPQSVTLVPAPLSAHVEDCADAGACALPAGHNVVVTLRGPRELRTQTGTLIQYVNGVPGVMTTPVTLDHIDALERYGRVAMAVPTADGGLWQIRAEIGANSTMTAPISISP